MASVIILLIIIGQLFTINAGGIDGSTNALRTEYIESLGYNIDETALSVKQIVIPEKFSAVYERYNALQKKAGFDLSAFKNREACVYTYRSEDSDDTVINLIISDGRIVGGDVSSVRLDGEMKPLTSINSERK